MRVMRGAAEPFQIVGVDKQLVGILNRNPVAGDHATRGFKLGDLIIQPLAKIARQGLERGLCLGERVRRQGAHARR